jgi:hypothetical protein
MSQSRFGGAIAIFLAVIVEVAVCSLVLVLAISVFMMGLHWSEIAITIAVAVTELLSILAIWAALYYGILRKRTPRRPILSLVILLILPALATVGSWFLYQKDIAAGRKGEQQAVQQAETIALADLSLAVDRMASSDGSTYSVNLHPGLTGEAGRIEKAAHKLLFDAPDPARHFAEKRTALDIDGIMIPKSLAAAGGLDKATDALVAIRAAVAVREAESDAAFAACRKVLAGADIDAAKKRAALAEFDRRVAADKVRRSALAEEELGLFNEMMAIVGELKDARGHWRVVRGTMYIDDEDVRDRIQDHWENIAAAVKRLSR